MRLNDGVGRMGKYQMYKDYGLNSTAEINPYWDGDCDLSEAIEALMCEVSYTVDCTGWREERVGNLVHCYDRDGRVRRRYWLREMR